MKLSHKLEYFFLQIAPVQIGLKTELTLGGRIRSKMLLFQTLPTLRNAEGVNSRS